MSEYFKLLSTYDTAVECSTNTKLVRIEILQSTENYKKFRARAWEQNTYNLFPTLANIAKDGSFENKLGSSDQINNEITMFLSEDPNDLCLGKEWKSESEYLSYLKTLVKRYSELFN